MSADGSLSRMQQSSLEEFLAQLPELWRRGEASPTHQPKANPSKTRDYRTRPDPFDGDWTTILQWLEQKPDATASSLLAQLIAKSPEKYDEKQLRTLQRRIGQWRYIMAKQLVFGTAVDHVSTPPQTIEPLLLA